MDLLTKPSRRERLALRLLKLAYKTHPDITTNARMIALMKGALKSIMVTGDGLVKIDAFDIFVDRDNNIYVRVKKRYHEITLVHQNTKGKATDSIWPTSRT